MIELNRMKRYQDMGLGIENTPLNSMKVNRARDLVHGGRHQVSNNSMSFSQDRSLVDGHISVENGL